MDFLKKKDQMKIKNVIEESIEVKQRLLSDKNMLERIQKVIDECTNCFRNGGKILFCGNGGSAADAQHLAAELTGRFYYDRKPLYAEALHVNTSALTAVANDYSYDEVFSRQVLAKGKKGDILIGLSTSGNSPNVLNALLEARQEEMVTIGLTGEKGGKMKDMCDYLINVPSNDTPRIQEAHILIGHIICEMIEFNIFPK